MEGLSFENIMSEEDAENLFLNDQDNSDKEEEKEEKEEKEKTVEINPDNLFEEESESVGSGDDDLEEGGSDLFDKADDKDSPNTNFYSSIATALRDEGILPDLDDDSLKNIKDPEDFAQAIEKQVQARLDEKQKRIDQALNYGVEVSQIKQYENTISYLDSLTEDDISDESEQGETLRMRIIMQDYLNRGFSRERAERETKKSFAAGTDLEDAKESLIGNKEFFSKSYQDLIEEAKRNDESVLNNQKKQKEELKKSLLDSNEVFDGVQIDKNTRQKIWDNLTKPVYKDSDGNYYSSIQKYEMDNKIDFMKKLGVLFTLTDGFKDIDKLVGQKVQKEKRRSLRELENTLKSNSIVHGGQLEFLGGSSDLESNINLTLDI